MDRPSDYVARRVGEQESTHKMLELYFGVCLHHAFWNSSRANAEVVADPTRQYSISFRAILKK
jgi:hypothetical protein